MGAGPGAGGSSLEEQGSVRRLAGLSRVHQTGQPRRSSLQPPRLFLSTPLPLASPAPPSGAGSLRLSPPAAPLAAAPAARRDPILLRHDRARGGLQVRCHTLRMLCMLCSREQVSSASTLLLPAPISVPCALRCNPATSSLLPPLAPSLVCPQRCHQHHLCDCAPARRRLRPVWPQVVGLWRLRPALVRGKHFNALQQSVGESLEWRGGPLEPAPSALVRGEGAQGCGKARKQHCRQAFGGKPRMERGAPAGAAAAVHATLHCELAHILSPSPLPPDPCSTVAIFMGKSDPSAATHRQQSMVFVEMGAPGVTVVRRVGWAAVAALRTRPCSTWQYIPPPSLFASP